MQHLTIKIQKICSLPEIPLLSLQTAGFFLSYKRQIPMTGPALPLPRSFPDHGPSAGLFPAAGLNRQIASDHAPFRPDAKAIACRSRSDFSRPAHTRITARGRINRNTAKIRQASMGVNSFLWAKGVPGIDVNKFKGTEHISSFCSAKARSSRSSSVSPRPTDSAAADLQSGLPYPPDMTDFILICMGGADIWKIPFRCFKITVNPYAPASRSLFSCSSVRSPSEQHTSSPVSSRISDSRNNMTELDRILLPPPAWSRYRTAPHRKPPPLWPASADPPHCGERIPSPLYDNTPTGRRSGSPPYTARSGH